LTGTDPAPAAPAPAAPEEDGDTLPPARRLQTRSGALEYVVSGRGRPGIVLLNGAGVPLHGWRALYPDVERMGTVFAWNRFGMKGSDDARVPQSGAVVLASLRELLGYAGLRPPYVLVGHSLGGLFANLFARVHPAEVAGVLFVEATHPRDHEVLGGHETQLARALSRLFDEPQWRFRANLQAEMAWVGHTVREIDAAGPFPDVPVEVVTGGMSPPRWLMSPAQLRAKREHQQELARLSSKGRQVIARRSGHFPQLTEPKLVLAALGRLIERSGRTVVERS
jgi:pimeloyl-ACP methyl ester carboxylesterase